MSICTHSSPKDRSAATSTRKSDNHIFVNVDGKVGENAKDNKKEREAEDCRLGSFRIVGGRRCDIVQSPDNGTVDGQDSLCPFGRKANRVIDCTGLRCRWPFSAVAIAVLVV